MATQLFKEHPVGTSGWFLSCVEKSQSGPHMVVVDLTPSLAETLLKENFGNRSVRRTKLAQFSSDMAAGKWSLNGEPIIIAKDGKLNDGQHRCLAAIDANATIPVNIVFGFERETRLTVDQGGARSASDFLNMEGVANAAIVSAVARMAIGYEQNNGQGFGNASQISSAAIRDRVASDAALAEAATFGHTNQNYSRHFIAGSVVGFAYYLFARISRDDAITFLSRVCRGDGLRMRDPAHTVREKLRSGEKYTREEKVALLFRAWNFHRRGMKVSRESLNAKRPFPALT